MSPSLKIAQWPSHYLIFGFDFFLLYIWLLPHLFLLPQHKSRRSTQKPRKTRTKHHRTAIFFGLCLSDEFCQKGAYAWKDGGFKSQS